MVKDRSWTKLSLLGSIITHCLFEHKQGLTIRQVAEKVGADYKNTHQTVETLFSRGIVKKEKIGNYVLCKLNYAREETLQALKEYNFYVKLNEFRKKHSVEEGIIRKTIGEMQEDPFFICLVFGSSAQGEEKKNSDLDIMFIGVKPAAEKILAKINAPYQKKFHVVEQSISDFIKDLKDKNKLSLATELYKKVPVVFYGEDIFFRLLVREW